MIVVSQELSKPINIFKLTTYYIPVKTPIEESYKENYHLPLKPCCPFPVELTYKTGTELVQ